MCAPEKLRRFSSDKYHSPSHTHTLSLTSAQVLSTTLTARLAERYGLVVSGYARTNLQTVRAIGHEVPEYELDLREEERRTLEANIGAFIQAASGHATVEEALRFLPRELPCPRVELIPIDPNDKRRWAPGSGSSSGAAAPKSCVGRVGAASPRLKYYMFVPQGARAGAGRQGGASVPGREAAAPGHHLHLRGAAGAGGFCMEGASGCRGRPHGRAVPARCRELALSNACPARCAQMDSEEFKRFKSDTVLADQLGLWPAELAANADSYCADLSECRLK